MTFPTITYKFNGLEEAKTLTVVVEQKFTSLEKLLGESKNVQCEVEFEKVAAQLHGPVFRIESNLTIDGVLYRAEATEESFESAIDEVRAELDKELRRSKDKQVTLGKAAGREMKEQLING